MCYLKTFCIISHKIFFPSFTFSGPPFGFVRSFIIHFHYNFIQLHSFGLDFFPLLDLSSSSDEICGRLDAAKAYCCPPQVICKAPLHLTYDVT